MNNYERIINLSIDELSVLLYYLISNNDEDITIEDVVEWLK